MHEAVIDILPLNQIQVIIFVFEPFLCTS